MRNHSLYNLIKDKLSPRTQKKLEAEMEYHDMQASQRKFKATEEETWTELM